MARYRGLVLAKNRFGLDVFVIQISEPAIAARLRVKNFVNVCPFSARRMCIYIYFIFEAVRRTRVCCNILIIRKQLYNFDIYFDIYFLFNITKSQYSLSEKYYWYTGNALHR